MFRHVTLMLAATTLALVGGCSATGVDVNTDYNRNADFSGYATYSFISDKPVLLADAIGASPLLPERLMNATRDALGAKGLRYVEDPASADFVVSFTVGARDKIRVNSYPADYRRPLGMGGWGAGYFNEVDVRNYTEGTLAIDLFDVASKRAVWHGWAVKSITGQDRANPEPLLREAVNAILAEFPPTPDA